MKTLSYQAQQTSMSLSQSHYHSDGAVMDAIRGCWRWESMCTRRFSSVRKDGPAGAQGPVWGASILKRG